MNTPCRLLLLALLLSFTSLASARHLTGRIVDDNTDEDLQGATVELLSVKDSSVIRSTVTTERTFFGSIVWMYDIDVDNNTTYLLRVSMVGYATQYKKVDVKMAEKMNVQLVEDIRLKTDSHTLSEVVVKATKIKMVLHGDTIVYNADAFNLSEGSMLDALIRQLPGATLNNGVITVNGRAVTSLLIDGRDFFNGDAKRALENLPAYTVSKVKVYDKQGKNSRLMGRDMGDKSYVIDIGLKKQYNRGAIINTDLAAGTHDRYNAKLFGLGYTKKSRLTVTGMMNNVSDGNVPGEDDALSVMPDAGSGLQSRRSIGIDYRYEGKREDDFFASNNSYSFSDNDSQSRTNAQTFLTGGDYYNINRSANRSRTKDWSINQSFGRHIDRHMFGGYIGATHSSGNAFGSSLAGQFSQKPWSAGILDSLFMPQNETELLKAVVNRQRNDRQSRSSNSNYNANFNDRIAFGSKDVFSNMMNVIANFSYERSRANSFTLSKTDYLSGDNPTEDHRNQYTASPNHNYNINATAGYFNILADKKSQKQSLILNPSYSFRKSYNSSDNELYRLDRLSDYTEDAYALGVLPSSRQALMSVLDETNTYRSRSHTMSNQVNMSLTYLHGEAIGMPTLQLSVNIPLEWKYESLDYFRLKNYSKSRNTFFFQPMVSIRYQKNDSISTRFLNIDYNTRQSQPDLTTLLDIRDDSNPLVVNLGNPNLKKARSHSVNVNLNKFAMRSQQYVNVGLNYNITQNAIATATLYDKSTGRTTTQQQNINGNWNAGINLGFGRPIDRKKRLSFRETFSTSYNRSVDLTTVDGSNAARSKVNNWNLTEYLKFTYQLSDRLLLGLGTNITYQAATSAREDFQSVNAWTYNVSLNGKIKLPLDFELSTDLVNYSRRGYNDPQMNTSELIWNARLTKHLLKKMLSLSLDGFDILGKLNSTTFTLDSQGRTERWANSVPRYFMLHASYKLMIGAKRQKPKYFWQ